LIWVDRGRKNRSWQCDKNVAANGFPDAIIRQKAKNQKIKVYRFVSSTKIKSVAGQK